MYGLFKNTRSYIIFSLLSIAVGLSLSKPLISLGLIVLSATWVFEGNLVNKIKRFWDNKVAVILSSVYLLTLIGLTYTHNFDYAVGDVRRKLALFCIPFLLSGFNPLTKKEIDLIFKVFIIGVLGSTLWSLFVYLGGLDIDIVDKRNISRFGSHIRFGLMITLSCFFSLFYFYKAEHNYERLLWLLAMIWLSASLFLFNLFTGMVIFIIVSAILLLVYSFRSNNTILKIALFLISVTIITSSFFYTKAAISDFYSCEKVTPLEEIQFTPYGLPYRKDTTSIDSAYKENGYYVKRNISLTEVSNTWNKRSDFDFYGKDLKGQPIRLTIYRFITSKGQRKDKDAVNGLTQKEIEGIENGIPNYRYLEMNWLEVRLHQIIWEIDCYSKGRNFNGHSVLMRWEYLKTALRIVKKNWVFGVGTGDVQDAFNNQYEVDNSILEERFRLRAHNQYITYGVTFGITGFFYFLFFLGYPMGITKMYKNYFYLSFYCIALLSMVTEDTLETQVGINFFVLFNSILLLGTYKNKT